MGAKDGSLENMVSDSINNFYSNKKIFVTGHTGFKGAWLIAMLNQLNAKVKGYALAPKNNKDLYNVIEGNKICTSVIGDIRDQKKLEKELLNFNPDIILHLASQALVRYSYKNPLETFEVNAIGTANLLEAARKLKHKCAIIVVTTDKVYANLEKKYRYKETDRLGGYDPYSTSKVMAEHIADSYRKSFFTLQNIKQHKIAIATARSGNVIGGGDWSEDRLIPDIFTALEKNKKVFVRNPNAVRPWQFVLDTLYGYLPLAKKLHEKPKEFSGAWNFGPNKKDLIQVKDIINSIARKINGVKFELIKNKTQPHEAGLLMLSVIKSQNKLKWTPKYSTDITIEKTIDWYIQNKNQRKLFTHFQIKDFLN